MRVVSILSSNCLQEKTEVYFPKCQTILLRWQFKVSVSKVCLFDISLSSVTAKGCHTVILIRRPERHVCMLLCLCPPASSLLFSPFLYPSISALVHTSLLFSFLPPVSHQVRVSISTVCRGDLSINLESPAGTVSLLLDTRPNDASTAGLTNWTLMTVHSWGEQPRGLWTIQVREHVLQLLPSVVSRPLAALKLHFVFSAN